MLAGVRSGGGLEELEQTMEGEDLQKDGSVSDGKTGEDGPFSILAHSTFAAAGAMRWRVAVVVVVGRCM